MTLLEIALIGAVAAAAVLAGGAYWRGELDAAEVRRDLRLAEELATDFQRGHGCWTATGSHSAGAMMTAVGRTVPVEDPGAWSASFGSRVVSRLGVAPSITDPGYMTLPVTRQWVAIHLNTSDAAARTALERLGGGLTAPSTVTVELARRDALRPGRRMMMSVREGSAGC